MSGPALRKRDSHYAIHESAYGEAEELTEWLFQLLLQDDTSKAQHLVEAIVEHWKTRTLAHAEEEENGLYGELLAENPELTVHIAELKRDHDVLRYLVQEIEDSLSSDQRGELEESNPLKGDLKGDLKDDLKGDLTHELTVLWHTWGLCQGLLSINRYHSRREEALLL